MKLRYAFLSTLLILTASLTPAKVEAQCPTCFVAAWLDNPASGQTTNVDLDAFSAAGWAFQCFNGSTSLTFSAMALQNGVVFSLPVLAVVQYAREDVSAMAVSAGCANPTTPGFTLTLGSGYGGATLQPGAALISVTAWYQDTPGQGQVRAIQVMP